MQTKFTDKKSFKEANYFGTGIYNFMLKSKMTGRTYMKPISMSGGSLFFCNVSFEPGARCFWHKHVATKGGGQIIICTAGEGWYQEEGKKARALKKGDFVYIKPGVKHWHGAAASSWFSHLSVEIPGEESSNEWLEEIGDDVYGRL